MPISVKDIQEKEFSRQKRDGYNIEEVDDFLNTRSRLAERAHPREHGAGRAGQGAADRKREARSQRQRAAPAAAEPVPAPIPAPEEAVSSDEPAYDEPSYFKNLQLTLRDTLINAQRIADETVAEARKKAQEVITGAEEQAATTVSNAKAEAESVKAEADNIRKTIATYRANFRVWWRGQVQVLKETDSLFD